MKKWKAYSKKEKTRILIITSVILVFLLLGMFVPILFPGTLFAGIISNSIGKFFNLISFFKNNYVILLECITIIIFVWILNKALLFFVEILSKKGSRSETVGNLLKSVVKYLSVLIAFFLILSAWNVPTPTLLAGAGILGLALSFGAQSLIEDVISGLFIIFEKQFSVGDVIELDGFRGIVREIGIRTTKFEDLNGDIKILNNSDIRGAINTSNQLSIAICHISISYSEDILKVEDIIKKNLDAIKEKIPAIEEGPTYKGIERLDDSSVVIRIQAKVKEMKKYQTVRDLNREMKILFDQYQIQIPFPQLVVHQEKE